VPGVTSGHHVLGVKHLLDQFGHGERAVLLAATGRQRRKAGDEEMQPREWYHVNGQLPEIRVELTREPEARCYAAHGRRHQVI